MLVLTIWQPWAWAIFHAGKDVENRTWGTKYRGRLHIHAGQAVDLEAVARLKDAGFDVPNLLPSGVILGSVLLRDCVRDSPSKWADPDCWHWLLSNPRPLLRPVKHRGRLGLHSRVPRVRLRSQPNDASVRPPD